MATGYNSAADQRAKGLGLETNPERERELRQLVDAVPQHIVVLAADGRRLHANQVALDFHGLTLEEFLAEVTPAERVHAEDLERYIKLRQSGIKSGAPWEVEIRLRRKDGQSRWFLIRANPLRDERGRVLRWYLAGTDIEERKKAERELRQLIDIVPQYMCVDGTDGNVLYANDRLLDYFGLTLEEAQANDFRTRVFHPEDLDRARLAREDAISRGVSWEVEARILRKDGQYRWFLIRFNPFRDEQGNIVRWYAAGTDIHDRKQAEAELRQLVNAVPQHIIVLDGEGRRLHTNQPVLEYHGYTLEEFLLVDYSHCFHPDDLKSFERKLRDGIASGKPWETEVRVHRKDGQYRWFLTRANPLRDDQGRVMRWYVSRTDIEDRKRAEREVQQIVDAVPQQIVVLSADGGLRYSNQVTVDFYGWELEDFLDDNNVKQHFHPDDLSRY